MLPGLAPAWRHNTLLVQLLSSARCAFNLKSSLFATRRACTLSLPCACFRVIAFPSEAQHIGRLHTTFKFYRLHCQPGHHTSLTNTGTPVLHPIPWFPSLKLCIEFLLPSSPLWQKYPAYNAFQVKDAMLAGAARGEESRRPPGRATRPSLSIILECMVTVPEFKLWEPEYNSLNPICTILASNMVRLLLACCCMKTMCGFPLEMR
jgi:hypothetical protein